MVVTLSHQPMKYFFTSLPEANDMKLFPLRDFGAFYTTRLPGVIDRAAAPRHGGMEGGSE